MRKVLVAISACLLIVGVFWRTGIERTDPRAAEAVEKVASEREAAELAAADPRSSSVDSESIQESLRPVWDFQVWLEEWQHGSATVRGGLVDRGVTLARERRALFKQLIVTDPRRALELAVPAGQRASLPAAVQALIEERVDAVGDLDVIIACGGTEHRIDRWARIDERRYRAFVFGRRAQQATKRKLSLHGVMIDDVLALSEEPFRRLDPEEKALRSLAGDVHALWVGNTARILASPGEEQELRRKLVAAESQFGPGVILESEDHSAPISSGAGEAPPTAGALSPGWTIGQKRVLFMQLDFSDDPGPSATNAEILASMGMVDQYFQQVSNGRCSMVTTILPALLRFSRTKSSYVSGNDTTLYEPVDLARAYDRANGGTGMYDPDRYDRWIVLRKWMSTDLRVGNGALGSAGAWLYGTIDPGTIIHELGHNHGLAHSNGWRVNAGSAPTASTGTHIEYGDPFDIMGTLLTSRVVRPLSAHFNPVQKEIVGYLDVASTETVVRSGTYRLFRHDHRDASGIRSLRIPMAAGVEYRLEYRYLSPWPGFNDSRLRHGIRILWAKGPSFTVGKSVWGDGPYLLDLTPGSIGPNEAVASDLYDAGLPLGETFTDSSSALRVTPVAIGGMAPREYIDVRIDLGTDSANRDPAMQANLPPTLLARTNLFFPAAATDPDGDPTTVFWDFGDSTFSPSSGTSSHRWLIGGPYTVTARATDGRGGTAIRTFSANVVDPLLSWTLRSAANSPAMYDVIFGGGRFIAAGRTFLLSSDGVTWNTASSRPVAQEITYGLAMGGGRYVAVGVKLALPSPSYVRSAAYSADGQVWQLATLPPEPPGNFYTRLESVAYGAGGFVAIGNEDNSSTGAGKVYHSVDGSTWSEANAPSNRLLTRVRFANGLFVVIGSEGYIATSIDGRVWTKRNLSFEHPGILVPGFMDVHYHGGRWIALGTEANNQDQFWTSSDGNAWTQAMPLHSGWIRNQFSKLGAAHGAMVAFGTYDQNDQNATTPRLAVSEDTTAWSAPRTVGGRGEVFTAIAEGNGTAVVVGNSNNNARGVIYQLGLRSSITTHPQTQSFAGRATLTLSVGVDVEAGAVFQWYKGGVAIAGATSTTLMLNNSAVAAGSYTVTVTNSGGTVTSNAAVVTISNESPRVQAAAPAAALVARTDIRLTASATDPDGDPVTVSWDFGDGTPPQAGPTVTHRWLKGGTYTVKITALDGKGGIGATSLEIRVADPLLVWTRRGGNLNLLPLRAVAFGANRFVAVGREVLSSADGAEWERSTVGSVNANGVSYGAGRFVFVTASTIYYSTDSHNWEPARLPNSPGFLTSVAFGAGRFVAVGTAGKILFSPDGVTWGVGNTTATADFSSVAFSGDRFVVASDSGPFVTSSASVVTSADGDAWTVRTVPNAPGWSQTSVARHAGRWFTASAVVYTAGTSPFWNSDDAVTWTKSATTIPVNQATLNSAGGALIAAGDGGRIAWTESGAEWATHTVGENSHVLVDVAEGNGTIVLVGRSDFTSGIIYQSAPPPAIATQPLAQKFDQDSRVTLSVGVVDATGVTYQWSKDGIPITGATAATLVLINDSASAGTYTVTVTNGAGSVTSSPAAVTAVPPNPGRLVNLSIRTHTGAGAQTLIMGVVLGGAQTTGTKEVLIRGIGPSLGQFGVIGFVADPTLTVLQGSSAVATNDNWGGTNVLRNVFSEVGGFALGDASSDAALFISPAAGSYTVQVSGMGGTTGTALAEIYDATPATRFTLATPRLVNVSARTQLAVDGAAVIAGFAIGGTTGKTVLIRAIGPTLGRFGVDGVLVDPTLQLFSGVTRLTENDNWGGGAALAGAFAQVGAFGLDPSARDAALLIALEPGSYTVQVGGVAGATGVVLVEIYEVP